MAQATLRELGSVLPHLVSTAVACPEEPYDGNLQLGDVEIRFRSLGLLDRCSLDLVLEVRSKWSTAGAQTASSACPCSVTEFRPRPGCVTSASTSHSRSPHGRNRTDRTSEGDHVAGPDLVPQGGDRTCRAPSVLDRFPAALAGPLSCTPVPQADRRGSDV